MVCDVQKDKKLKNISIGYCMELKFQREKSLGGYMEFFKINKKSLNETCVILNMYSLISVFIGDVFIN